MIRDAASQRQVDAADPRTSTWLAANAGSGKTRVLTDRVARLLLEGVSPQNILCLTYTKAAAAEMQNRLFKRLGEWAMMADEALRDDLRLLGVDRSIGADDLRDARTLFARAIETPGGLKIQTIHAFCASVLRRFPLEAEVSPQFREMDDRQGELLRAEVTDQIALGEQSDALHDVLRLFTGDDLSKLTAELVRKRDDFQQDISRETICKTLDLDPNLTIDRLVQSIFNDDNREILQDVARICGQGGTTEQKAAKIISLALDRQPPGLTELEQLEGPFLFGATAKSPFSAKCGTFPNKATREAHPELTEALNDLMLMVQDARDDRLALITLERTLAIYRFGQVFVPAYEHRKLLLGMLDFDDLIRKTKALLTNRNVAEWVLFRLDGGIDHMLVDEAQDTSPDQWTVIRLLAEEFAAGEGAQPERERTIFVVGDKKQSIYSFQGADPVTFDDMKSHFDAAHRAISKPFAETSLDYSFRSSQAILSVVDETFVRDRAAGMEDDLKHIAFKENMPGRVDLWPVITKPEQGDKRNWFDPVDEPSETDHTVLMATRIADQIKHMIKHETLPGEIGSSGQYQKRKITEGDILILVQRRSDLFAEIIRACKNADLNIAGADRLRVGAELAVKDLGALLSFLALPEDDLSLAAALRSPLFGWSEQDLFTLAHHRPEKGFLWPALRDSDHESTLGILHDLRQQSDFLRPYDLIERILTRHGGRHKLLARLGPEAEDGIDALLSQALAYESTAVPSLTGFLTWMETDDLEIKRQMDSQGDRIRVMTVHGAKGLEAPIVILPDTAKRRIDVNDELLPAENHLIWKPPAKQSGPPVTALRDAYSARQEQERLRLLYVAMTRAEKWLIVGAAGDVGEGDQSWYNIVADGMQHRGDYDATSGNLGIRRVSHLDWYALDEKTRDPVKLPDITVPHFDAAPKPDRAKTISPSELPGAKVLPGDPGDNDPETAKTRGTMIHRLLEHLPLATPAERLNIGQQLVGQDNTDLVHHVATLLDSPNLKALWTTDALVEVDITADIPNLGRIHGTIDRLLFSENGILAVDYKSNHLAPTEPEQTPQGVLRQLAVYATALAQIYPDQRIDIAILWTQTATLMPIPASLLHEALNSVTDA